MPKNTAVGLYIGLLSLVFGFAMTWHIWWLALISFAGVALCLIIRLSGEDVHDVITAAQVRKIESDRLRRIKTS